MKKKIAFVAVVAIVLSLLSCVFVGCAKKTSSEDAFLNMKNCIVNSLKEDIYYYKKVVHRADELKSVDIMNVNIFSPLNSKEEFEKNDDGTYKNMKASIYKSNYEHTTKLTNNSEYFVGSSVSAESKKNSADYMLQHITTQQNVVAGGKNKIESTETFLRTPYTVNDLVKSKNFVDGYSLNAMLFDLNQVTFEDIVFDVKNGAEASKQTKVTKFSFAIGEEFFAKFKEKHGRESVLVSDKIFVETAYGRISNIVTYKIAKEGFLKIDDELFNLQIVYYGPIIKIPSYDEKSGKDYKWTETALDFA